VDGHHDDVTRLPDGLHPGDEVIGGGAGKTGQEIDAGPRDGPSPGQFARIGACWVL
jgi:hypothetical protein